MSGRPSEDKDDLRNAAFNGTILQALADITGESTVEIALDMSKWFHRMFYAATDLWTTGALIPSNESGGLRLAIEMAMYKVPRAGRRARRAVRAHRRACGPNGRSGCWWLPSAPAIAHARDSVGAEELLPRRQ